MLVLTTATQALPVFSTYEWKPFRTLSAIPFESKANFKNDKPISKMWLNDYSWMTRKFYLPLKLNLSRWKMGRNWSWGGALQGRGWEWVSGCNLGWDVGIFFFYKFIYLFIYLWLCWVFVSVRGLSLVVASRGHSSSWCAGLSLSRPLLLRSTGSRRAGSVIVAHGPSCSAACGIFPDQGSNPRPLHWQADAQPLRWAGTLGCCILFFWIHWRTSNVDLPSRGLQ